MDRARAWRSTVFDAGFGVPDQNIFHSAMSLVAPSILVHGSAKHRGLTMFLLDMDTPSGTAFQEALAEA